VEERGPLVELYRLLGEDVARSLSPGMMNAAFRELSIDASYEAVSVGRGEFRERFLAQREEARGFNLTIPFKSDVLPLLDSLDEVSARIGAVNVVAAGAEGRWHGYNTDVDGITVPLREHGAGRVDRALLLGAGGAARAFCEAMSQLGCTGVTVAARDDARGGRFVAEMAGAFPRVGFSAVTFEEAGEAARGADLVFNATPLGSRGLALPEALKRVIYGHVMVFDAVYRPMETELLRMAEERGSPVIYGYEMLLNQGTRAFEIWTGRRAPRETMESSLRDQLGAGGVT
jgi:shikimate dehydrogenase